MFFKEPFMALQPLCAPLSPESPEQSLRLEQEMTDVSLRRAVPLFGFDLR